MVGGLGVVGVKWVVGSRDGGGLEVVGSRDGGDLVAVEVGGSHTPLTLEIPKTLDFYKNLTTIR